MKTFVMLSVICLVLIMDSSSAPVESEERSSEERGNSEKIESGEVKMTSDKKLFRNLSPKTSVSFLSSSFMYKCRK